MMPLSAVTPEDLRKLAEQILDREKELLEIVSDPATSYRRAHMLEEQLAIMPNMRPAALALAMRLENIAAYEAHDENCEMLARLMSGVSACS